MTSNQPVDWEEIQLGELFTAHYGKSLTQKNRVPGKYKVYGSSGITGTHNEFLVKGPGLIIGRKGTIGNVYYEKNSFYPIDTTYYVKESNRYDLLFLYYKLKTLDLDKMNTHSAVPGLNREQLYSIKTKFPKITEQKAIANILSTLDEKIETNNQINEKLEEMAQALFKHWFVDFEFPNENGEPYKSSGGEMVESELGMIPKGWEIKTLGNYVNIKSGFAFKSSWWKREGVPVIKIKNIANKTISFNDVGYVDEDKVEQAKLFKVTSGDLLIALTGATLGKIGLVYSFGNTILVNQRVGKFFLGDDPFKKLPFLYTLLNNKSVNDELISLGMGSAQPNVSPKQIESIKVPMSEIVVDKFNSILNSFFKQIVNNLKENEKLSIIRDTLLPKLMSGEIRVPLDDEVLSEQN